LNNYTNVTLSPTLSSSIDKQLLIDHFTKQNCTIVRCRQAFVEICKVCCHSLPPSDSNGLADPYIVCRVGSEVVKSRVLYKTLNPEFSDRLLLRVEKDDSNTGSSGTSSVTSNTHKKYKKKKIYKRGSDRFLEVSVYDRDLLSSDDYLGSVFVCLDYLPRNRYVLIEEPLSGTSGVISFLVRAYRFGRASTEYIAQLEHSVSRVTIDQDEEDYCNFKLNRLDVDDLLQSLGGEQYLDILLKKLKSSVYAKQFRSQEECMKFARVLANVKLMKRTYMNLGWAKDFHFPDQRNLKRGDDFDSVHVKIIVMDQTQSSDLKKTLRTWASPFINHFNMLNQCKIGLFHSALAVGPWLIEFNSSGIIIPRKCLSRVAMLSSTVMTVTTYEQLEQVRDILAEKIVEWNLTKLYKSHGGDRSVYGNCQELIDSILNQFGVKMDYSSILGSYIQDLREHGSCKLSFKVSEEFSKYFNISEKSIVFHTHEQVDNFVINRLQSVNKDWIKIFPQEYELLMAFDRAFWMRYNKMLDTESNNENKTQLLLTKLNEIHSSDKERNGLNKQLNALKIEMEKLEEEMSRVAPAMSVREADQCCPFGNPLETKEFIYI
jgi:hypothetical protein